MITTLKIIKQLSRHEPSANHLQITFNISRATLNRHLAEARHLGAKIEAYKNGAYFFYRLNNWNECKKRVELWIDLMEKESVIAK